RFDSTPHPTAASEGTIVTFTVDRLAYSPSPPVVFAVVDFDAGGRLPIELTDVDAEEVAIGLRVEATFRRLSTADGIHNYFWKARPVRRPEQPRQPRQPRQTRQPRQPEQPEQENR
uniref:Zn-ribbon domain-containing OB-fold protein n=1 Tax=Catenulispora pinisilvae TaxID=2705253 RepID=UPI001E55B024